MGKSAVKGLFYNFLIAATFLLAAITIIAGFSGNVSPLDSALLPLLGLAVPVWLVCNLMVALCWALARKAWTLIPLIALFCNGSYLTSVIQLHPFQETPPSARLLKIATYNVRNFGYEFTGYSCKEIALYMQQEQVDILCFQEFGDNAYFPMDSIRQALSHWSYALIPKEDAAYGVLPIAVFSRYPLINERWIAYPQSSNCSLMCEVVIGSDTLRLLNNHLQTTNINQKRSQWQRERTLKDPRREARIAQEIKETLQENFVKRTHQTHIIGYYAKTSPYPVIVCGDLNSLPSSYTYRYLNGFLKDGFRTAGNGYMYTYRYGKKMLRIDYLFHSNDLKGVSYYSPTREFCSDHNPVILEVNLTP